MRTIIVIAAITLSVGACHDQTPITGCGLCALQPTLVVTGKARASLNPLPDATITLTAYRDSCTGAQVLLLPSPAEGRTDSTGFFHIAVQPTQAVAAACIRASYSDAMHTDTVGIALHTPPAKPETLHVDVTGP